MRSIVKAIHKKNNYLQLEHRLNRDKPVHRKSKVILIYAVKNYEEGTVRNKLRDLDIEKVVSAFKKYEDVDRYCHIADFEELKENEFNLNVTRYVDISEPDEDINIQDTIDNLKKLDIEKQEIDIQVRTNLKELGFSV